MEIWSALAIGFFGSFHCIGMCGPIALALPGKNDFPLRLIGGRLLYNMGRVITYSLLGLLFGLVGHSANIAGLQQSLSIFLGVLIIVGAFFQIRPSEQWKEKLGLNKFYSKVEQRIRRQFKKQGMGTLLIIGLLNGLLPCGFVYVGLAGAVTTGSILQSGIFMALFGLGTIPAMMTMALAPSFITIKWRQRINNWIPYLAVAFGIYLIIRGIVIGEVLH
ncbi:sulfite exporter TauE/SafE family protein [Fodinibius sp.]|uniref:sulfite exporter TauE/SafE family protein n=1 Tax=Fodinibius sp. TaxID=1872440 RepID=UPI002ACEE4C3|nr:sulfite exporter TauE/SafE family protein [Fodinibius sp.]MDZ7660025.1 sulfite exporter TauE/SafE family protein [Fodinibius sp.]